jgi:periplasmic protein CpxP/Spy
MTTKTKWLAAFIAVLVLTNLGLMIFIWSEKEESRIPPPIRDAREYLVKTLALDDTQLETFDSLRKIHFEKVSSYRKEMRGLKDEFFSRLSAPRSADTDTLAQRIGIVQTKIDLETFDHFSQLRSLLNKEQTKKFDNVIQDVLRTMGPRQGPPQGGQHRRPGDLPPGDPPH